MKATMTDGISSIIIKTFINPQDEKNKKNFIVKTVWLDAD